jgi:hypothetical protein
MSFIKLLVLRGSLGIALPSFLGAGVLHWSGFGQAPAMVTQQSQWGDYRASLSYQRLDDSQTYQNLHLKVTKGDELIVDRPVDREDANDRPMPEHGHETFTLQDLDGDNQPEVLLDLYTGGVHCCTYSLIYPNAGKASRKVIHHDWGNAAYSVRDLNQDGLPELTSGDDRFAYAFSSYAASGYPLRVWRYSAGQMQDVTQQYPEAIAQSAEQNWQQVLKAQTDNSEVRGYLAAYLADQYSLGQADLGWQRLQEVYQERDRTVFFQQLRQFLEKNGYGQPVPEQPRQPQNCLTCQPNNNQA